ncbi:hypothetical protein K438DRAFT_1748577 [Mycena galopus ATCC 62051]|nr:hypothetical protein K438DRAFT_1748577 [Mycena galopus ATCC 62051]
MRSNTVERAKQQFKLNLETFAKKATFSACRAHYKLYRDYQPFKFGNRDIQQRRLGSGEMAPGRKLRVRSWVIPDLVRRVKLLEYCLVETATAGNVDLRILVSEGADVNFAEGDFTPLFHAAENMNLELIRFLLASGADPNLQGTAGDLVPALLAGGANLHVKGNRTSLQKSRTSRYSASSLNARGYIWYYVGQSNTTNVQLTRSHGASTVRRATPVHLQALGSPKAKKNSPLLPPAWYSYPAPLPSWCSIGGAQVLDRKCTKSTEE